MGVNYYVALQHSAWPTIQALQECIDRQGWPVRIGEPSNSRWLMAFDGVPNTLGLPIIFMGEPLELEASFITLSPTKSFAYSLDLDRSKALHDNGEGGSVFPSASNIQFKPKDINEELRRIGATNVNFSFGDRVLALTFRINNKEWQAGLYLMSALIKCFDGYGFSLHDGRHGGAVFADLLIAEAAKIGAS